MKPKTILQKTVFELSNKLPKPTETQLNWSYNKCFEKFAVRNKSTLYCLECGHNWKDESELITALDGTVCPNCEEKLKMHTHYKPNVTDVSYSAILTTKKGFQVVRMLCVSKQLKKGEKPIFYYGEVMQHFINESGVVTSLSKKINGFSQYYDSWIYSSDLSIQDKSFIGSNRYNINPNEVCPKGRILPIIKRNGYKGNLHDIAPHKLFSLLLSNQNAETLLKTNQIDTLQNLGWYNDSIKIAKHWNSIKICIKNNYTIKNFSDWSDYINLLTFFGKDIRNAKYVCPIDLNKEHNRYVAKKIIIDKKKQLEEMKAEILDAQISYTEQKKAFIGLQFSSENITVKVLETVQEFMEEGDEMKHCVFASRYHEKEKSLILSATVEGKRVETVEVSLVDFRIVQSRGIGNKKTVYNDKIIDLVTKNLNVIRRRNKKRNLKEVA